MARMWMERGEGGSLYDAFRERGVAAVGWNQLAAHAKPGVGRKQLIALYRSAEPQVKQGTVVSGASQIWRFANDIQDGDWIVTYSPANRLYSIGKVTGPAEHHPEWAEQGMPLAHKVQWQTQELPRDSLGTSTKNSLGLTLTVFEVPSSAAAEVLAALKGKLAPAVEDEAEEVIADPLADIESQALERIKDRVNELDWDDMPRLVAGILRAMGYKTQVSPPGADRGKDIVASPDGFGFEHPRIVVEVKHRKGQMSSQEIRSFLGGRHKDDRGLYVSTGGFTKDAQYEADRASIPLAMWTLDHVVPALIEHHDKLAATAALFPDAMEESELGDIPKGWEAKRVGDLIELAYGKALKSNGRKQGTVPVYGSGGVTGYHNEALVPHGAIIVGRKATVGSLYWEDKPFFPIDTTFYVKPKAMPMTYCFYVMQMLGLDKMNTDAAVPDLNRENVYRLELVKPSESGLNDFDELVGRIRQAMRENETESRSLAELRDTLPPKLLSGEIAVDSLAEENM